MSFRLVWRRVEDKPGLWLIARAPDQDISVRQLDEHIAEIVRWSETSKCGRRMAYDMWQFKNEHDMTVFMLKWS